MITVGEVLKNKRERLKISLDTASSETRIQKRFLQYIEKDEFFPFESEVFLTGFIKIYAKYLNLDVTKILALYRRTNPKPKEEKNEKKDIYVTKKERKLNITPKTVIIILLVLCSALIIGYIGSQIYKFQRPPLLTISSPQNESTVTEEIVKIVGKTEKDVSIEINDVVVETNEEGEFEKEIVLVEGSNLVKIKAKKNNNSIQETVETVKITYKKPTEEPQEEEIIVNKIKLEVFDSAAWIKLDIDDENKLSQVVQPSETEYEIKNKLHVTTGRVSNTRLFFNGELLAWPPTTEKGVAGMECTIVENSIKCE